MRLLDINTLDPGIRDVVAALRAAGFETTDSGDGRTKEPGPDVLPYPHVAVLSTPERMIDESRRLLAFLRPGVGDLVAAPEMVQAMFDPADDSAVIMVFWEART